MMELKPAVQGDVNDIRSLQLLGVSGGTISAVEGHVWQGTDEAAVLACTHTVDGPIINVEMNLGNETGWLATAESGTYKVEVQVTWSDGTVLTWPPKPPAKLYVRRQGA